MSDRAGKFAAYPARSRRNMSIAELDHQNSDGKWVAGRLIAREKGALIIQDQSGQLKLLGDANCTIGEIVEFCLFWETQNSCWRFTDFLVLAGCDDFFINSASPNYQKWCVNRDLKNVIFLRGEILKRIRSFFDAEQFLEVETPTLVRLPGMEPFLEVFKTEFKSDWSATNQVREDLYLITSPEYAMKKMVAGGWERIYQITRSYRNQETFSDSHNPEFTILEWYRAYASYEEIMSDTERLFKQVYLALAHQMGWETDCCIYGDWKIPIAQQWPKISVQKAFEQFAAVSEDQLLDEDKLRAVAIGKGYTNAKDYHYDDLFHLLMLREVEPELRKMGAVFLYDYPLSQAALAKRKALKPEYAERFELFVGGLEVCNGFSELNDPEEQKARLEIEQALRQKLGKLSYDVDQSYIRALNFGLPPTGGNALGVDRLVMILTNQSNIQNVMTFPYRDL